MPVVEKYEPGMFCWNELGTSDAAAAKTFYSSLMGLSVKDNPMPDGSVYTMLQKSGKDAAAIYANTDAPPNWATYVNVDDADATAKKATDLGAHVIVPPFDVMDFGRMAVIADPQGAVFCLWQAKTHVGATVRDETGTICWNELLTKDIEAARDFYTKLFGWTLKPSPEYTEIYVGSQPIGGMMQIRPEMGGMPPLWWPYFAVSDCDASAKKAATLGGKVYMEPRDIAGAGRFSVLADPQGASFNVIQLPPR